MRLFLVSLGILFASTVLAYAVVRYELDALWPQDLPRLPHLLWFSTLLLVTSSGTMQMALRAVRRDDLDGLRWYMGLTLVLGMAFLALQAECWISWLPPISQRWGGSSEFRLALAGFYVLTGLHALHVIGGIIPMAAVTRGAFCDAYTAGQHAGVHYCAMYWHFLDAVWLALFATLLLCQ